LSVGPGWAAAPGPTVVETRSALLAAVVGSVTPMKVCANSDIETGISMDASNRNGFLLVA
jgi:hypothetical protein